MFEFDPTEYEDKKLRNPGYGPCAGQITDSHIKAGPFVEWADGESPGPVARKHLVNAPAPGSTVQINGENWIVKEYPSEGVVITATSNTKTRWRDRKTTPEKIAEKRKRQDENNTKKVNV